VQLICAVVRPFKVKDVCDGLGRFGFRGLTVTEVSGFGKQRHRPEIYRGTRYAPAFQPYAKVEIVAADTDVRDLIEVICKVATTGRPGDGMVWVIPVVHVIGVRAGQVGADAV
jgi:nitrogen regulatory protein P-II 1